MLRSDGRGARSGTSSAIGCGGASPCACSGSGGGGAHRERVVCRSRRRESVVSDALLLCSASVCRYTLNRSSLHARCSSLLADPSAASSADDVRESLAISPSSAMCESPSSVTSDRMIQIKRCSWRSHALCRRAPEPTPITRGGPTAQRVCAGAAKAHRPPFLHCAVLRCRVCCPRCERAGDGNSGASADRMQRPQRSTEEQRGRSQAHRIRHCARDRSAVSAQHRRRTAQLTADRSQSRRSRRLRFASLLCARIGSAHNSQHTHWPS